MFLSSNCSTISLVIKLNEGLPSVIIRTPWEAVHLPPLMNRSSPIAHPWAIFVNTFKYWTATSASWSFFLSSATSMIQSWEAMHISSPWQGQVLHRCVACLLFCGHTSFCIDHLKFLIVLPPLGQEKVTPWCSRINKLTPPHRYANEKLNLQWPTRIWWRSSLHVASTTSCKLLLFLYEKECLPPWWHTLAFFCEGMRFLPVYSSRNTYNNRNTTKNKNI